MFEPGTFFEIFDREFHSCVFAVELVGFDGCAFGVTRDECMVSPIRPQHGLGRVGEARASHNETHCSLAVAPVACRVEHISNFSYPVIGIGDLCPCCFRNRCDRRFDIAVLCDGDRPCDPELGERVA